MEMIMDSDQGYLQMLYTTTVDDIKYAKTQMWQITLYALMLMFAMALLRNYGDLVILFQLENVLLIVLLALVIIYWTCLFIKTKNKEANKDRKCFIRLLNFILQEGSVLTILLISTIFFVFIRYREPDNTLFPYQQREDIIFDVIISIIAISAVFLLTKIRIDIVYKYRLRLKLTIDKLPSNIFKILRDSKYESNEHLSWWYDWQYWLILSLSIFMSAVLLSFFIFK